MKKAAHCDAPHWNEPLSNSFTPKPRSCVTARHSLENLCPKVEDAHHQRCRWRVFAIDCRRFSLATRSVIRGRETMEHHRITGGGGIQLHLVETGKPDGRPILFIHGFS